MHTLNAYTSYKNQPEQSQSGPLASLTIPLPRPIAIPLPPKNAEYKYHSLWTTVCAVKLSWNDTAFQNGIPNYQHPC
jgi:hypothetical protein